MASQARSSAASAQSPSSKGGHPKGHDKFDQLDKIIDKNFSLPGFTRLEVLKAVSESGEKYASLVDKILDGSLRESDIPNLKNKTKTTNNTASLSSPEEEGWSTQKANKTIAVVSFSFLYQTFIFFTSFFNTNLFYSLIQCLLFL